MEADATFVGLVPRRLSTRTTLRILSTIIDRKPVNVRGSALDDLRAFPSSALREAGYQIHQVQHGQEPDDSGPARINRQPKMTLAR
jgi:hypothetical protein